MSYMTDAGALVMACEIKIKCLFDSQVNKVALIIGAGPSLEGQTKFLEIFRDDIMGVILATDAATKFLSQIRLCPDYVVSIDASINLEDLFFGNKETVGLVHSPQLQPDILRYWTGPKFIFLTKTGLHGGPRQRQSVCNTLQWWKRITSCYRLSHKNGVQIDMALRGRLLISWWKNPRLLGQRRPRSQRYRNLYSNKSISKVIAGCHAGLSWI